MARLNDHYLKLAAGYLFPEIARRMDAFKKANPSADVIKLGIGDVVLPLASAVREAMHAAIDEMATAEGFRGYGPSEGYDFLREAIAGHDFASRGVRVDPSEIFVSDGSKCDSANIQEIFAPDATLAVSDPVYPVYVDTNVMAGRIANLFNFHGPNFTTDATCASGLAALSAAVEGLVDERATLLEQRPDA